MISHLQDSLHSWHLPLLVPPLPPPFPMLTAASSRRVLHNQAYAEHAGKMKGEVEQDDVMLAIQLNAANSFVSPPGQDVRLPLSPLSPPARPSRPPALPGSQGSRSICLSASSSSSASGSVALLPPGAARGGRPAQQAADPSIDKATRAAAAAGRALPHQP